MLCPHCRKEILVGFKAVELTSWGTLRTLGMKQARQVRLPLNRWVTDQNGYGFTVARTFGGARFVAQLAMSRKDNRTAKRRPHRTAILLVLGRGLVSENRWACVSKEIFVEAVLERSPRIERVTEKHVMPHIEPDALLHVKRFQ